MTDAPAIPTPAPAAPTGDVPGAARPPKPGPTRFQQITAITATIGVVVALIGLLLLLRPVSTPTQDCGTSLGVLLDGRPDEFVSVDDPPKGVTEAEAKANNERPCRTRVAEAARPAAIAIGVGVFVAVAAALSEVVIRALAWRQRSRAGSRRVATSPSPGP